MSESGAQFANSHGPFLYDVLHQKFYRLSDGFTVGRGEGHLTYPGDTRLSRQHCRFHLSSGSPARIEDLGATNGTAVDSERLPPRNPRELKDGAVIELGDQILYYTMTHELPAFSVDEETQARGRESTSVFNPGFSRDAAQPSSGGQPSLVPGQSQLTGTAQRPAESTRTQRIERSPRIRTLPLHGIAFKRTQPLEAREVGIANISTAGIGFIRGSAAFWPPRGGAIAGLLIVGGKRSIPLSARVVRVTPLVVGCIFEGDAAEIAALVKSYFQVELAALRVKDLSAGLPAATPGSTVRRYADDSVSCELRYELKNGELAGWQLTVFGNRLEWAAGGKIRFTQQNVTSAKAGVPPQAVLPEAVKNAIRFVENIESLDEEVRGAITYAIGLAVGAA